MSVSDRWRAFVEDIPAVKAMRQLSSESQIEDDETAAYSSLLRRLPATIAEVFDAEESSVDNSTPPDSRTPVWCFADMPEGDFPRVYAFTTLHGLLAAMARREGTDTAVWPFFGFPFRLLKPTTQADGTQCRYMQLDATTAVKLSSAAKIESRPMSELAGVEFETEGWLGDPAMRSGQYFIEAFVETGEDAADIDDEPDEEIIEDTDDEGLDS